MENRLLNLIDSNAEAKEKVAANNYSKENLLNIILSYIPDYTEKELISDIENIKKANAVAHESELNFKQLEKVAATRGDVENRLLNLIDSNAEAKAKVSANSSSKEDLLEIISSYIPDYSEEELISDAKNIKKTNTVAYEGELDLEQLAKVAGGQGIFFADFMKNMFG